jgi:transposase
MERFVINVLKECATVTGACRVLGLSWDEVFGIMERAVQRGLVRRKRQKLTHIGVDEKAFKKGHSYMTVVCDHSRSRVLEVYDGRGFESLAPFWQAMTPKQRARIEAVSMDMLASYYNATLDYIPKAEDKIVYDRFHIMRLVNRALDHVQRQEHHRFLREGNPILKGTRAMWRYSEENLPEKYHARFAELKHANLKVARAWALKESLRQLWDYRYPGSARKFFQRWYFWATHSRLKPMITVARMLKERLDNIVTFCKHRITNGLAEGINSKIMAIKRRACGYRNQKNFKTAIYFFCANLAMDP